MSWGEKKRASCFIPRCPNTSAMGKVMVTVPNDRERRRKWFDAAQIREMSKRAMYCCEDHFLLEEDAANWTFFRMIGNKLRIKHDVVPHLNLDNPGAASKESQVGAEYKKMKENVLCKLSTSRPNSQREPTREGAAVQTVYLVASVDESDAEWKPVESSEDAQTAEEHVSNTARTVSPENDCTIDAARNVDDPIWACDPRIHEEEPAEDCGSSKENVYNRRRQKQQMRAIATEEIVRENDGCPVWECDVGIHSEKPPEDVGTSKKKGYNRARRKQQIRAIATEESNDGLVWVCDIKIPTGEPSVGDRTGKENSGESEQWTGAHLQHVLTADSLAVDRSENDPVRDCDVRTDTEGSSEDEGTSDETFFAENVCNRTKRKLPTDGLASQEQLAVERTSGDGRVRERDARVTTDDSSEDEGTSKEFKAHKLKVKRLKRTAVPTLQLPSTVRVNDEEERPHPSASATNKQSEPDEYSIGSYVCTTCGHLFNSEPSFFEHLNSHVKVESHDKGDSADVDPLGGAVEVKVELDESRFLPEEGERGPEEIDPLSQEDFEDVDPLGGGAVEVKVEPDESMFLTEEDERGPDRPSEEDHNDVGSTFVQLGNKIRKIPRRRLKWVLKNLLNKTYWDSGQRLVQYPPFSRQKVEQGEIFYWSCDFLRFKCKRCPFMAQSPRLYNVHLQTHADGRQFGCSSCQDYFDSEESLIASHTSGGGTACSRIAILDFHIRCEECWEYYKNHQELVYHVEFDACVRRIKVACPVCNMEVVKNRMENHLKNHKSKTAQ